MNRTNQNPNNTVWGLGDPPPGGGDGIRVVGSIPMNVTPSAQASLGNTSVSLNGVAYNFQTSGNGISSNKGNVTTPSGLGILAGTQPCAIALNNTLCLFWNGAGRDGIWGAASSDGSSWSDQIQVYKSNNDGGTLTVFTSGRGTLYVGYVDPQGTYSVVEVGLS